MLDWPTGRNADDMGSAPTSIKKKIYVFCNGGPAGFLSAMAMCEDGTVLAEHICSNVGWMPHDMGMTHDSDWKHDAYNKHCGEGNWELEWVDNPKTHPGMVEAYRLNQLMRPSNVDEGSVK